MARAYVIHSAKDKSQLDIFAAFDLERSNTPYKIKNVVPQQKLNMLILFVFVLSTVEVGRNHKKLLVISYFYSPFLSDQV